MQHSHQKIHTLEDAFRLSPEEVDNATADASSALTLLALRQDLEYVQSMDAMRDLQAKEESIKEQTAKRENHPTAHLSLEELTELDDELLDAPRLKDMVDELIERGNTHCTWLGLLVRVLGLTSLTYPFPVLERFQILADRRKLRLKPQQQEDEPNFDDPNRIPTSQEI